VLPLQESKEEVKKYASVMTSNPSNGSESSTIDIEELVNTMCSDEGKFANFCVLLHGSLKVEGMVAICQVGNPDWYGMLYSWVNFYLIILKSSLLFLILLMKTINHRLTVKRSQT